MRIITLVLLLCASVAFATPPKKSGDIDVESESRSHAGASSQSSANVGSIDASGGDSHAEGGYASAEGGNATGGSSNASSVSGDSSAINEGNAVDIEQGDTNFNSESTNTNVVLVPNNNTSDCQRVIGFAAGTGDGAASFGIPLRDRSCDYEQAADDAAASGNHKIAWWWRCYKKSLYKTFVGDTKEQQHLSCWNSMTAMLEVSDANFNEPQLLEEAVVVADWNAEELVAQLSDEQYEKLKKEIDENEQDHNEVERRQAEQETLIETQAEQIERLKREAEALRKAEEARRAAEEAAKSKFAERLEKRGVK